MSQAKTMRAVLLTGHGGFDMLDIRDDVAVPQPAESEVLIKVGGAGINNTDINTRVGWYAKSVTSDTESRGPQGFGPIEADSGWGGQALAFPRIQGADCCGEIVAVGSSIDSARIGQRVLVRTMMSAPANDGGVVSACTGSERDGGFAEYMTAVSKHALEIDCAWSDAELASIPCAYSTAEAMLHKACVGVETVLITGASGGVGSAAVQLAKRRGAKVIAIAGAAKMADVQAIGADFVIPRGSRLIYELGTDSVDVVVDLVAGNAWPDLLQVLKRGGRYVTSGAIAGPMVELDVRTLYLKDLTLIGSTHQDDVIFENLINYIEREEIKPLVAKTYPLNEIVTAQKAFLAKNFTGKIVLIP